jgi:hypothetical protein
MPEVMMERQVAGFSFEPISSVECTIMLSHQAFTPDLSFSTPEIASLNWIGKLALNEKEAFHPSSNAPMASSFLDSVPDS